MAATLATFRATLPNFTVAAVSDETLQVYLDMAERSLGSGLGDRADDAQIFLAAHLLSMAGIGPGSKASDLAGFTTIKAGSLTLTRSEKAAAGEYSATPYGVLYWRLWKRVGSIGLTVTGTGPLTGYTGRYPHGEA